MLFQAFKWFRKIHIGSHLKSTAKIDDKCKPMVAYRLNCC